MQSIAGLNDDQVSVRKGKSGTSCPNCGGNNRYSFKSEEDGGWACRHCGGGDGWELLQKVNRWGFKESVEKVGEYLGIVDGNTDFAAIQEENEARRLAKETEAAQALELAMRYESKVWERSGEANPRHPWIAHKNLSDTALSVCRQKGDKLLIPAFNPKGVRVSHQSISQKSNGEFVKLFKNGIPVKGLFCEFGTKSHYVLIGESFADADAAFQLSGSNRKAICAFSAGQIPAIVEYASKKYPESQIVICADNDEEGRRAVEKASTIVPGIAVSYPPSGKDWSQYFLENGKESPLNNCEMLRSDRIPPATEGVEGQLINGRELSDTDTAVLSSMNGRYCHTVLGGRHVIARAKYCPINGEATVFEPLEQFKNYFHHIPQVAGMNAGSAWIKWPSKHHKLGGLTFQPNTSKCPANVYNLWRGFSVEPIKGDCTVFLEHLRQVICSGEDKAYSYFIGWLAHMIQKPDEKPSVAIFMRSVMGAGKDTAVKAISMMLGIHAATQNGDEQVTGRFQGALQEKLFVFINEARVTDSRAIDKLKSLISENVVSLELKGKDPVTIPNFARFVFASNHDHVIRADPKERRYLMLEPRPIYKVGSQQHYDYFAALHKWIDNGGASHLLEYLQTLDLTGFNPHSAPATSLLNEQKQYSMKPVHQFFMQWLERSNHIEWKQRVPACEVRDMFLSWAEKYGEDGLKPNGAGRAVNSTMKAMGIDQKNSAGRYYPLPELESMKARFAGLYDSTVEEMF